MPLAADSRLGPYKVQSLLGSGAMGEVYRARDTRLGRDVAIKIIKTKAEDLAQARRFENEVRAVSSLNHPNIVTVHDVGHEDGLAYLVTELVEGESLRKYLNRGMLSLRKVLDIGVQIARGLAAAHEAGIVHRDLKPENIMVTPSGLVKILDFGLAKEVGADGFGETDITFSVNDTAPGLLIGTTAYMSPEQAKGGRVNFYADQFAFGLILYEMLTGEQPFRRETPLQTLSAVLTEDPPEVTRGSVPLRWLVKRCLHKEPDHRYTQTNSLVRELENVRQNLTESTAEQPVPELPTAVIAKPSVQRRVLTWPVVAALALVIGAALGAASVWLTMRAYVNRYDLRYSPFAVENTFETWPAWSPNGRTIAYSADVKGVLQILSRSLGTGSATQLTHGEEDCMQPFWSPDGTRIFYTSKRGGASALWSVGATGGSPQLIVDNVLSASISPDGKTLAIVKQAPDGLSLWIGPLGTEQRKRIDKGPLGANGITGPTYLRFAPDGKRLGVWLTNASGLAEFWEVPTGEGQPTKRFTDIGPLSAAPEFTWMHDSKRILFSQREGASPTSHIYAGYVDSGHVEPFSNGTGSEFAPYVDRNGRQIAVASGAIEFEIVGLNVEGAFDYPFGGSSSEWSPALQSNQMVYITNRFGSPEIWLQAMDEETPRRIVSAESFPDDGPTLNYSDPVLSPDGRRVAYSRLSQSGESIWISTVAGDPPVKLAEGPAGEPQRSPSWSPDGNYIAYSSVRKGVPVLLRAHVGSLDRPTVLGEDAGSDPKWSPRNTWIATLARTGIQIVSPDGVARKTLGSGRWIVHGWDPKTEAIYGIRAVGRDLELARLDTESGEEMVVRKMGRQGVAMRYAEHVGLAPFQGFSPTEDGRFITSMLRASSDIWVVERKRK